MDDKYTKLFDSGKWMIRTSDNGKSYQGFPWQPIGEWTIAPDWNDQPECGGGLHGQNNTAFGFCYIAGQRLELCETKDTPIAIDGNKVKCHEAKIIAVDEDIPIEFLEAIGLKFKGRPSLNPLTSVGGNLYVHAKANLPALTSVGGDLHVDAKADLPALTSVGEDLYVHAKADLPSLTSVGGVKGRYVHGKFVKEELIK